MVKLDVTKIQDQDVMLMYNIRNLLHVIVTVHLLSNL